MEGSKPSVTGDCSGKERKAPPQEHEIKKKMGYLLPNGSPASLPFAE